MGRQVHTLIMRGHVLCVIKNFKGVKNKGGKNKENILKNKNKTEA